MCWSGENSSTDLYPDIKNILTVFISIVQKTSFRFRYLVGNTQCHLWNSQSFIRSLAPRHHKKKSPVITLYLMFLSWIELKIGFLRNNSFIAELGIRRWKLWYDRRSREWSSNWKDLHFCDKFKTLIKQ